MALTIAPTFHVGPAGCPVAFYAGHSAPTGEERQTHLEAKSQQFGVGIVELDFSNPPASLAQFEAWMTQNMAGLIKKVNGDPAKVYGLGFSSGATKFSYLASNGKVPLKGIIPASGWRDLSWMFKRNSPKPFRWYATAGTKGDVVPINGNSKWESLFATATRYAALNGQPTAKPTPSHPKPGLDLYKWSNDVMLLVVNGGGHCWPGQPQNPAGNPQLPAINLTTPFTDYALQFIKAGG
jgi:poly(3-hydroxybutyrate) depolymerase